MNAIEIIKGLLKSVLFYRQTLIFQYIILLIALLDIKIFFHN